MALQFDRAAESIDMSKKAFTVSKWFRTDKFINSALVCSPVLLFGFFRLGCIKKIYIDGKLTRTRYGVSPTKKKSVAYLSKHVLKEAPNQ